MDLAVQGSKILDKRLYKNRGYILITENIDGLILRSSYSWPDLYYIGESVIAYHLWSKHNISKFYPIDYKKEKELTIQEKAKKLLIDGTLLNLKNNPCSIGFSDKQQKWYGWSHRAIAGFTIGSKITKTDIGFQPSNKDEFIESILNFYDFDKDLNFIRHDYDSSNVINKEITSIDYNSSSEIDGPGVRISVAVYVKDKRKKYISNIFEPYPQKYGIGEWEAKTLEDAKQMAIDFAKNVG